MKNRKKIMFFSVVAAVLVAILSVTSHFALSNKRSALSESAASVDEKTVSSRASSENETSPNPKSNENKSNESSIASSNKEVGTEKPSEKALEESTPKKSEASPEKEKNEHKCSICVRCDTALSSSALPAQSAAMLPADGTVLYEKEIVFNENDTAFDVLLRELRERKIHMEFNRTPGTKSVYIEGIANLYEFDCGELSGWMFKHNNTFPSVSCSEITVSDGDTLEWLYTCDMGRDIGSTFPDGGAS